MNDASDLPPRPPQYTPEEWAEYHHDPCGWCIKELRNPDPGVRCNAADILRGLARDAEAAIPALVAGFDDPDPAVRPYCVHALVDIGYAVKDRASVAVPALTALLRDEDAEIRCLAAHALGAIGRAAAGSAGELRGRLSDPDEETREAAASALKAIEGQG
jgi:HEAT repeat protein